MTLLQVFVSWFKRRVLRDQRERWNHQYATGRWEKLKAPAEQARFDACAGFLRRYAPAGRVLEIGCGEGPLQQRLAPQVYASWHGVDISEVAIAKAQAFAGPRVCYTVADMTHLQPTGPYDAIVFPESIYYVPQRATLLRRYAHSLDAGGVFIISIFETKRSAQVWAEIHAVAVTVDSRTTTNELGTWICEVLRLR